MADDTRPDASATASTAVFAAFIRSWLEAYRPLLEALDLLAGDPHASETVQGLWACDPVERLREAWLLWLEWGGRSPQDPDSGLEAFLSQRDMHLAELAWRQPSTPQPGR